MSTLLACQEAPCPDNIITCLKKLIVSPIRQESLWNVYAYVINQDIVSPTGAIDDLRAYIFPLGGFCDYKKAEKHVKKLIETTGYNHIVIAKYGMAIPITVNVDTNVITQVTVDTENKLINMENEETKRQKELYEEKVKYEQDLKEECQNEGNVDHIEYFKRQAYLASMHYQRYHELSKKRDEAYQAYQHRKTLLNNHLKNHPEHKELFLPFLKEKLSQRGENDLYKNIEQAYDQCQHDLYN